MYLKLIMQIIKNEKVLVRILFSIALAIYFIFGFYHLSEFVTADEHFWLPNSGFERISDYWNAVQKGKWKETRINDKPGITLAYTAGIAMLFDNAKGQIISSGENGVRVFNPERTLQINFLYRVPILVLSGLFSLYFFWIIRKITKDEWIALWSTTFILLSPILLGISQIVNPDSLFWIFASASLLSFFAYLQHQEKKTATFSSLFLGFGLASKYVSVILFPFFFFMMIAFYVFQFEKKQLQDSQWKKMLVRNALVYVGIIAGGMLIFALMMPASFVEPKVFYFGTIGFPGMQPIFWAAMILNIAILCDAWLHDAKVIGYVLEKIAPWKRHAAVIFYAVLAGTCLFVVVNYLAKNSLMNLSGIAFDLKQKDSFKHINIIRRFIVEFRALVFALTPLVLFSLIAMWIKSIFQKSKHELLVFVLSAFYLVFYAAVLVQGLLVTVRYSIVLFPFSMILAAIAIRELLQIKENTVQTKRMRNTFIVVFVAIAMLFVMSLLDQKYEDIQIVKKIEWAASHLFISLPLAAIGVGAVSWIIIKHVSFARLRRCSTLAVSLGIIAISVLNIWLIKPFYFSYTNDLLPKEYIISGAWGYGGYEAAQYLNNLPDAKTLTVWSDVYGVCEFFVGKCTHNHKIKTNKVKIDYYFRSLQSSVPLDFPHPMEKKPVWRLDMDGRKKSFLKIFKALPLNADNLSNAQDVSPDDED